jgi:L-rhamnose mutarotase
MKIRPDRLDEYIERHRSVWPEMLAALSTSGWRNYTLFHDGVGTVFAVLESDDFDASLEAIGQTDVAQRWTNEMLEFFEPGTVAGSDRLVEYFHLD